MFYDPIIKDHLPWLNDAGRNYFYKRIIDENCKDKICVDIGAGSGILTDYALQGGAKKVYCIEIRKSRAKYLREKYKNQNVEVIEEDFLKTDIRNADVFFLEQIGCQWSNDFSIRKFMSHIKTGKMIPNRYVIKAYIYDGIVKENPYFLIDSQFLPRGFYEQSKKLQSVKPTEILSVYEINNDNCNDKIQFDLDLNHYKQCTIFLDDEIYYDNIKCEYENTYRDWKEKPYRLFVEQAKGLYRITWDSIWQTEKLS